MSENTQQNSELQNEEQVVKEQEVQKEEKKEKKGFLKKDAKKEKIGVFSVDRQMSPCYIESGVVRVVISILAVAVLIVYFYVDYKKTWNH